MLVMVLSCIGTKAFAEEGKCGENVTWSVADGVLTIEGSGAMYNYGNPNNASPWKSKSFTKVAIGDEVTTIGNYAFYQSTGLTSVTIPSGVKEIGDMAFYCSDISKVVSHIEDPFETFMQIA